MILSKRGLPVLNGNKEKEREYRQEQKEKKKFFTKAMQTKSRPKKKVRFTQDNYDKWPITKLTNEADRAFSKFIRQRERHFNDYTFCTTCLIYKPWQEMTNGHYINRGKWQVRFNEKNCNVQCPKCNWQEHIDESRKTIYALMMVRKYGAEVLEELQKLVEVPFESSIKNKRKLLIEVIMKYRLY